MTSKYRITYEKKRFLTFEIEAESSEEACEKSYDIDEKFGEIFETPYLLARSERKRDEIPQL